MGDRPHTHCLHGHALEGKNLVRNGEGFKECRTCRIARQKKRNASRDRVVQLAREFVFSRWEEYIAQEHNHPDHPFIKLAREVEERSGIPKALKEWTKQRREETSKWNTSEESSPIPTNHKPELLRSA